MTQESLRAIKRVSLLLGLLLWQPLSTLGSVQHPTSDLEFEGIYIDFGLANDPNFQELLQLTGEQLANFNEVESRFGQLTFDLTMSMAPIEDQAKRGEISTVEADRLRAMVFEKIGSLTREKNREFASSLTASQRSMVREIAVGIHLQKQYEAHLNKELAILTDKLTSKILRLSFDQDRRLKSLETDLEDLHKAIDEKVKIKLDGLWDDLENELLEVLSKEQKEQYEDFLGPGFEFKDSVFDEALNRLDGLVWMNLDEFGLEEVEGSNANSRASTAIVRHLRGTPLALVFPLQKLPIEVNSILIALELLQADSVSRDLDLVESQEKLIRQIQRDYDRFDQMDVKLVLVATPTGVLETPSQRLETGWMIPDSELLKNERIDIDSLKDDLLDHQWHRLEQIQLQWALHVSRLRIKLLHPHWAELLKLTEEQKNQWKDITKKFRELFRNLADETKSEKDKARGEVFRKFQEILEPRQIQQLYRLLGKRMV